MLAGVNPRSEASPSSTILWKEASVVHLENVIGAATFDLSGLHKEYFTTQESVDVSWVQTIFQTLGLQTLLLSSLQLEGFRHVIIHGEAYQAIVIRQKGCYVAILTRKTDFTCSSAFIKWAYEFEPSTLRTNPRFSGL
jgi:hypothetical protein